MHTWSTSPPQRPASSPWPHLPLWWTLHLHHLYLHLYPAHPAETGRGAVEREMFSIYIQRQKRAALGFCSVCISKLISLSDFVIKTCVCDIKKVESVGPYENYPALKVNFQFVSQRRGKSFFVCKVIKEVFWNRPETVCVTTMQPKPQGTNQFRELKSFLNQVVWQAATGIVFRPKLDMIKRNPC